MFSKKELKFFHSIPLDKKFMESKEGRKAAAEGAAEAAKQSKE